MIVTQLHAEKYKKWYLLQGHSYASTQVYFNMIKRYINKGKEISQKNVDAFRELSMRSTSSGALKSFFYYLVRHHKHDDYILNIKFDRNKSSNNHPDSLSKKEVEVLINNMPTLKYKYMTIMIFQLGLRISEVLKIQWGDFNWMEWIIDKNKPGKVALKNTKRNKFRTMKVIPELMKTIYDVSKNKTELGIPIGNIVFDFGIQDYILDKEKSNDENLFNYLIHAGDKYRIILYKISKEYLNKRITPHRLRHSRAQMLMDDGFPIESLKMFLGHKKISTTEIYAQASSTKVDKDLEKYDTLGKKKEIEKSLDNTNENV